MISKDFWKRKRIFLTGHTGFKGSWLSLWLNILGATVTGYALKPPSHLCLFEKASISDMLNHNIGDIQDLANLKRIMANADPEIIIHMAAQALVRESYVDPVGTYQTNVMGTVHVLESARSCKNVRAIINVTTDKCYENKEWFWSYRENEPIGGYDPYSSSKGCSELVTSAYRNSFFNPKEYGIEHCAAIASARAGNVIGGGDCARDRLIPDIIRSFKGEKPALIRSPNSIRPWQHVLEPINGYLVLAEHLYDENGIKYAEGWNFGPNEGDAMSVECIVKRMCSLWGKGATYKIDGGQHPHESQYLKLDSSKARQLLGWRPIWSLEKALKMVIEWEKEKKESIRIRTFEQINEFMQ